MAECRASALIRQPAIWTDRLSVVSLFVRLLYLKCATPYAKPKTHVPCPAGETRCGVPSATSVQYSLSIVRTSLPIRALLTLSQTRRAVNACAVENMHRGCETVCAVLHSGKSQLPPSCSKDTHSPMLYQLQAMLLYYVHMSSELRVAFSNSDNVSVRHLPPSVMKLLVPCSGPSPPRSWTAALHLTVACPWPSSPLSPSCAAPSAASSSS